MSTNDCCGGVEPCAETSSAGTCSLCGVRVGVWKMARGVRIFCSFFSFSAAPPEQDEQPHAEEPPP